MPKVEPNGCNAEPVKVTMLYKTSLVLACLGLILVAVASGFDDWLTYTMVIPPTGLTNNIRVGIFYACSDLNGCETDNDSISQWQWNAAYIYGTAIICNVVTVVVMVICCLKHSAPWAVYLKYGSTAAAFLSWIFVFASDFILVNNADNINPLLPEFDIDFGLVLSICGGCVFFFVGVLLSVDIGMQSCHTQCC